MTSNEQIVLTQKLIVKDFALEGELTESIQNIEELKKKLIPILNHLLNRDLNRLLMALYRIDVNEAKVKHTLSSEQPDLIADKLADLIIERELLKVQTRIKYS